MTLKISETLFNDYIDLVNKQPIKFDFKNGKSIGQSEVVIDGPETLFKLLKIVENERQANNTKMNDRSSKTHCCLDITVYTKFEDQVRVNYLKFLDMAGSERVHEVSDNKGEQMKGVAINYGLVIF